MDRSSFLASLPFLIRLPSPAWPPYNIRLVVLAGDHSYGSFQLSVECGRRRNPAFFATNTSSGSLSTRSSSSDPAQTPVELVLCNPSNNTNKDADRNAPVTAFLRVDGHVYALNLSAKRAMTMIPETLRPSDPDRTTQSSSIATPPSLCLDFGESIQLRLFRATGTVDDCVEDRAFWNGVRDTLRDAVPVEQPFHYESILASVSSPERSSSHTGSSRTATSSSTTDGHQWSSKTLSEADPQDPAGSDTATIPHPTTHDRKRPAVDEPHPHAEEEEDRNNSAGLPYRKLQRRHEAARECTDRLGRIRHILELPAEHFRSTEHPPSLNDHDIHNHGSTTTTTNNNNNPSTTTSPPPASSSSQLPRLGPLLTQTAARWPEAYLSADESHDAVRHWDAIRATALHNIERTLQHSFPSRQRSRRPHPTTTTMDRAPPPAMATGAAATTLEQWVEQHKQATVERYKLFLLPSRG